MPDRPYTTRFLKVGAHIDEMRRVMGAWDGQPGCRERIIRENLVASPSRMRIDDIVKRAFIPRFVESSPPNLWRAVAVLDRNGWTRQAIAAVHYYATASSEPVLWDFMVDEVAQRHDAGQLAIDTRIVRRFLETADDHRFPEGRWSEAAALRAAQGVLATLRDFGIFRGATKKVIAPYYLPVESFAFIARVRHELGHRGPKVLSDPCWRLFLLSETGVERFFVEAQQHGFLGYHAAGSVIRVEYPGKTLEEYAHVISQ